MYWNSFSIRWRRVHLFTRLTQTSRFTFTLILTIKTKSTWTSDMLLYWWMFRFRRFSKNSASSSVSITWQLSLKRKLSIIWMRGLSRSLFRKRPNGEPSNIDARTQQYYYVTFNDKRKRPIYEVFSCFQAVFKCFLLGFVEERSREGGSPKPLFLNFVWALLTTSFPGLFLGAKLPCSLESSHWNHHLGCCFTKFTSRKNYVTWLLQRFLPTVVLSSGCAWCTIRYI